MTTAAISPSPEGSPEAIANRLIFNGATEEEIKFLLTDENGESGTAGKRVELNAMTCDQFVAFVEE